MSDISLCTSPAPSITSFSTAWTSLPPDDIIQSQHEEFEEKASHEPKRLTRPIKRRPITDQTLLLSSPLATLIYAASTTAAAAALPLNNTTARQIAQQFTPTYIPFIAERGNVLRKRRAQSGRPERLVRISGPEVKVTPQRVSACIAVE